MTGALPSRRFREVQVLIGAALVLLVTVTVVELEAISALQHGAKAAALRSADLLAVVLTAALREPTSTLLGLPLGDGDGAALLVGKAMKDRVGAAGPAIPAFWPWSSRRAWEAAGRTASTPITLDSGSVVVIYRPLPGDRTLRVVHRISSAAVGNGPRIAGALGLAVAGGGALIAWLLLGRALAPYRELLDEAGRISTGGRDDREDRFLIDTFRTTVKRLEASEAELRQRADEIEVLAAGMAHELRNALATMTGYLRLLPDAGTADRERYVAAANREAADLGALLDRFLRLAQPRELRFEDTDVTALVRDRVEHVQAAFSGVTVEVFGDPVVVRVDRSAIAVALDNLVRNGVEAAAGGSDAVEVSIEADAANVLVRVDDRGPGVSPELGDRLFVPFATTKASGGLGLALARRFARLHGGDVTYAPRVGGGSTFLLRLPKGPSE
jgi:signal transduction histidine kinase